MLDIFFCTIFGHAMILKYYHYFAIVINNSITFTLFTERVPRGDDISAQCYRVKFYFLNYNIYVNSINWHNIFDHINDTDVMWERLLLIFK